MLKKCSVEGCDRDHLALGLCRKHYLRVRRSGSPEGIYGRPNDRFWAKVDKGDGCWCWTGTGSRYGMFWSGDGRRIGAHRFSYEMHRGPIPNGMLVMHTCDNPKCVNPDHLRLGTPKDNMEDMDRKGRRRTGARRGEACSFSALNADAVRFIRAHPEMRLTDLGERFGVTPNTIRAVRIGKTWTHVT